MQMMWRRSSWPLALVCTALLAFGACTNNDTGKGTPKEDDIDVKPDPNQPPKDPSKDDPPGGFLTTCKEDKDCDSGLCIDNLKNELVCSVRCETHSDCDDPGYRCAVYDSSGNDIVRACLPLPPTYCLDCRKDGAPDDSVCQGYGSRCVNLGEDGYRCGRDCSAGDESCPPGSECLDFFLDGETVYQCVPANDRVCSDCIDNDGDGYGVAGDNCPYEGFDCDDNDPFVNPGAAEQCDDKDWDCDGDPHNGFDLVNDPNHCGGCDISCHGPNMEGVCENKTCGFGACDDKFYDLNDDWTDGCEYYCQHEDFNIPDEPDELNTDTNCDGITGDIERAVFVSSAGDDDNPGTKDAPVRTLQRGQDIALTESKTQILVTSGNFDLQEADGAPFDMISGVSIYGGYHPDTWQRSPGVLKTNLRANAAIGLRIHDIHHRTVLSGVSVHGESFTSNGASSIAILLDDAGLEQLVELRYLEVNAGNGGTGTHGVNGDNGAPGGPGNDHGDTNNIYGVAGAKPGPNDCWTAGGDGGASHHEDTCSKSANDSGQPGQSPHANVAGGAGGAHGDNNCDWGVGNCGGQRTSGGGGAGGDGGKGLPGATAQAASDSAGNFSGINFTAAQGGAGHIGTPGGGGGGGGGGGTAKWLCGGGRAGTGGAGGGGGGCAGTGGTGGGGGGGSFGVVLRNSVPMFTNVQIRQGRGGQGGNGGVGGQGGDGGKGGEGSIRHRPSQTSSSHGKSGDGGKGGTGGSGSGGAGGCGGPSIGISLINVNAAEVDTSDAIIIGGTPGQPGSGGKGPDPDAYGPDGCQGLSAEIHSY